ncbi:MAG: LysR family transcriptional regulator [Alphaproteobacteria bacterium]
MALDWDDLRFFLAIARSGGVAAAAGRLNVTQSTVYRRLDRLEELLRVRLVVRGSRQLHLTAEGEDLLEGAAQMDDAALGAQTRILGREIEPTGTVCLTAPDDLANIIVLPLLAGFQQRHPHIVVELAIDNRNLDMSRREADIALRPTDNPPETLVGRKAAELGWAIYAHRSQAQKPMAGLDWVVWEENLGPASHRQWTSAHVPADRIKLRTNSLRTIAEAANLGVGAAMLPFFLATGHKNLVQVSERHPEWDTNLWILTHPALRNTARIRLLTSYLFDSLRQQRKFFRDGVR